MCLSSKQVSTELSGWKVVTRWWERALNVYFRRSFVDSRFSRFLTASCKSCSCIRGDEKIYAISIKVSEQQKFVKENVSDCDVTITTCSTFPPLFFITKLIKRSWLFIGNLPSRWMNAGAYYYDRKKRELDIVKCFPFVVSELLHRWFMVLISMSATLKLKIYSADQETQHFYGTKFHRRRNLSSEKQ